jgi:hypothetical protein
VIGELVFTGDNNSPTVKSMVEAKIAKVCSRAHVTGIVDSRCSADSHDDRVAYAEVDFDHFDESPTRRIRPR